MVDPVRCATPGTGVVCARYPECSAKSTIQSAKTPPPSPPIARIATVIALEASLVEVAPVFMLNPCVHAQSSASGLNSSQPAVWAPLQTGDHDLPDIRLESIPCAWIRDTLGTIKGRANPRGMPH